MEEVIKEVYASISGTAYEVYKVAVNKDSCIRLQGVKNYFNKRDDIQVKSKPKGSNSFVSPGANFEYEIYIMDIEAKGATSNTRYGSVAIGNFTKIAEVVAIKNRTPESMIDGLNKIISPMGKPKQLYSDEEYSMRSLKLVRFLNQNEIKYVQTSTHAHTVERFIRTFKDNLYRRLDALGESSNDWFKHISGIVTKYNNTIHSTIEIKLNEAVKSENHLWVNLHLQNNAKSNRKYPDIKAGDMVRVHLKPKLGTKAHEPKWSSTRHQVIRIDGNKYLIYYMPKKKVFLRHELLKV